VARTEMVSRIPTTAVAMFGTAYLAGMLKD
jgi:hypothetical protein